MRKIRPRKNVYYSNAINDIIIHNQDDLLECIQHTPSVMKNDRPLCSFLGYTRRCSRDDDVNCTMVSSRAV